MDEATVAKSLPLEKTATEGPLQFLAGEASGAFGDLGTFLPIVVGMTQIVGLDAGTVLLFAGIMNVASGLFFRIPIAVQPMKSIAAVALAGGLTASQVAVGGLGAGAAVMLMGAFGLIAWLDRILPRAVLRGLQFAVGFKLLSSGTQLGLFESGSFALKPLLAADGVLVFAAAAVAVLVWRRHKWAALALCAAGFGLAYLTQGDALHAEPSLWRPSIALSGFSGLGGLWRGALPQVPMTLLNSVLAVSLLATDLFPDRDERAGTTEISVSVGLMNLISCPLGGMPVCHGSGGLAAQHRFGARSGVSMVMLGSVKIIAGLFFGAVAVAWMNAFPGALLGVFLLLAGMELARVSKPWANVRRLAVALTIPLVSLLTGLLIVGFAAGWMICWLLPERWGEVDPTEKLKNIFSARAE